MAWKISASAPHGILHICKVELKYEIEGWKWKRTKKAFAVFQCGVVVLGKRKKGNSAALHCSDSLGAMMTVDTWKLVVLK